MHTKTTGGTNLSKRIDACWHLIRGHHWWNYKFPLSLAAAFAATWTQHIPFHSIFLPVLLILMAGIASAVFASVINDITDLNQDRVAGKYTEMMSLSVFQRKLLLVASLLLCLIVSLLLLHLPVAFFLYLSILAAFSLYSIQPFRLKERGLAGAVLIALGEHVLPALLAVFIVLESTGSTISVSWLAALSGWAVAFGLRGIIWHQLNDLKNDKRSRSNTFGVSQGQDALLAFGERIVFPIELICFSVLLAQTGNMLAWVLLIPYAVLEWQRQVYKFGNLTIVKPEPYARFVMFEYYQIFFPLSFLLAAMTTDPTTVLLVAFFCILFSAPIVLMLLHSTSIVADRLSFITGGHPLQKSRHETEVKTERSLHRMQK